MDDKQRQTLLSTAKKTIEAVINGKPAPMVKSDDPQLNEKCGCFVTIKNGEQLRGCIGQFISDIPLVQLVSNMAVASSTNDVRFFNNPITPDELSELDIEISILSPLKKTDDPLSLRLGVDGIYIKRGCASGCFLPQVAAETGWTKEQFLSYCCSHKAGLPANSWKDPNTDVLLFTAEVFGAVFKDIK
ncbi:MAG: AmmeMemoRadiSam system protein A [Phycisphaerae bacterium]|jgi:AmmeMemoRadiSam system protein A